MMKITLYIKILQHLYENEKLREMHSEMSQSEEISTTLQKDSHSIEYVMSEESSNLEREWQ